MNILFIGPLPEPITGQSLACQVFLDELKQLHSVSVVNLNKQTFENGSGSVSRIKEVIAILKDVNAKKKDIDIVYLTISESVLGNLKDLLIYAICYRKISRVIIHLHGGSFKNELLDKYPLIRALNKFFLKKIGGAIVLGPSHTKIFSDILPLSKIHIVPNFAQNDLFIPVQNIIDKFAVTQPIRVIFVSNLMVEKGYKELLDGFIALDPSVRRNIRLEFAGGFETDAVKADLFRAIEQAPEIKYHGVVKGAMKRDVFANAHVFCLPTNYLEGQPISILEAYASGCVVLTTNKGGICDIFTDGVNGYEILPKSKDSVAEALKRISDGPEKLLNIALQNRDQAEKHYKVDKYNENLLQILLELNETSGFTE